MVWSAGMEYRCMFIFTGGGAGGLKPWRRQPLFEGRLLSYPNPGRGCSSPESSLHSTIHFKLG